MTDAGILSEDDRLELIDGEIVEMAPIGPRHASCVMRLTSLLSRELGEEAVISVQNPIQLDERSELYPDVAVLVPRSHAYRMDLPGPSDVLLLIEVADTTVDADQTVKIPRYSRAGIAEVWLIDLNHDVIHVHSDPTPAGYRVTRIVRRDDVLQPIRFPARRFTAEALFPR
jgi:Uma2 family endonuclease